VLTAIDVAVKAVRRLADLAKDVVDALPPLRVAAVARCDVLGGQTLRDGTFGAVK
jgi:hypothetical protein